MSKIRNKKAATGIIIANIIFSLLAVCAVIISIYYSDYFDVLSISHRRIAFILSLSILTFPFTTVLSYLGWVFYRIERYSYAITASLLPLGNLFICLAGWVYI
jgi:hypothetical protein